MTSSTHFNYIGSGPGDPGTEEWYSHKEHPKCSRDTHAASDAISFGRLSQRTADWANGGQRGGEVESTSLEMANATTATHDGNVCYPREGIYLMASGTLI